MCWTSERVSRAVVFSGVHFCRAICDISNTSSAQHVHPLALLAFAGSGAASEFMAAELESLEGVEMYAVDLFDAECESPQPPTEKEEEEGGRATCVILRADHRASLREFGHAALADCGPPPPSFEQVRLWHLEWDLAETS